ncbi:hypothetical protein MMC30_000691 [Trapelia coarctata]|nr:hypothetical protein [Trapelia coarctata]
MSQPLDTAPDQFRLITILPLGPERSESAPVECHLEAFSLTDECFTPAYKKHLIDKDAPGAWVDPQMPSEGRGHGDGLGDWIHVVHPDDNATTFLPEFRYEWGDFLALSYTWGDPTNVREILVNGQSMLVTQNLEACLRALRRKQYVQNGWRLWIDAICINQKDIIERAGQVKRMREVYTKAWTPIIWLGEETEGSDVALDLIITLASEYTSRDGVNRLTKTLHQNPQHFGRGRWRALNDVVCRRYWRRLWILQEVVLGRNSTPVLCGHRTLPWAHFAGAFNLIINTDEVINTYITNELKDASLPFDCVIWPNLNTVNEIQVFQKLRVKGQRPNLYRLLHFSRTALSTDPRDKIYGLLALMDTSLASLIKPDYTDTVENVYRSFALDTIKATGSLDIIRHSEPSTDSALPSWAPDWVIEPGNSALTIDDNAFATSGSFPASVQALADPQSISCKGFVIDRFDGMGCRWTSGWSPDSVVPSKGRSNPYSTFEDVREAIWKSMVACHRLPSEPLDADYGSLLATPVLAAADLPKHSPIKDIVGSNVFDWCVRFLKGNADFQVAGRRMEEYLWKDVEPEKIDAVHLRDALMQRDRVNLGRRLVTTERGYVGMALETVERADVVAVLLGCSTPMVLRQVQGDSGYLRWKVVGECYLHGIMNGEAMGWGLKTQDIVLC